MATSALRPLAAFAMLGLFWGSWAALVPAVAPGCGSPTDRWAWR